MRSINIAAYVLCISLTVAAPSATFSGYTPTREILPNENRTKLDPVRQQIHCNYFVLVLPLKDQQRWPKELRVRDEKDVYSAGVPE